MVELRPNILGRELSFEGGISPIIISFPRSDPPFGGSLHRGCGDRDTGFERSKLDLGHLQPAFVFGRKVKLESVEVRMGVLWRQNLVERGWVVFIVQLLHPSRG